jgi:hypothetical protein
MKMTENEKDNELEIQKGAKYCIKVRDGNASEGIFRGFGMIGSESALVLEVDGKLRFIAAAQIVTIDVLDCSSCNKKEEKPKGRDIYYG